MAIILKNRKNVYNETIVYKNEKTNEVIFECDVNINADEAQEIKELYKDITLDEVKVDKAQEERIYKILFKDNYEKLLNKVGVFYMEEFAVMLLTGLLGKLGKNRVQNMTYVNSKYQKIIKK